MSGAGYEGGKLLSVTPVANQATAAPDDLKALNDWDIRDRVRGRCFDTTSSNTGRLRGAMARLELTLCHILFRFACRHYVLKLIIQRRGEKSAYLDPALNIQTTHRGAESEARR